jgi:serine/threonine protein kinase
MIRHMPWSRYGKTPSLFYTAGKGRLDPAIFLLWRLFRNGLRKGPLKRLEHEYALRTRLDREWAVLPLDLVSNNGRPVLVLDNPGGEPLDRLLGRPLELVSSLRIAAGLATALAGLHARGLIHKDIKPANILVDPITNRVWLTGFSIASELPREQHRTV